MTLACTHHTASIFDRGGERKLGDLTGLTRVKWERRRDEISTGQVWISSASDECADLIDMAEAARCELVIFAGGERVWEGPITRTTQQGNSYELDARDIVHYLNRTTIRNEYDSRYPNIEYVIDRMKRILVAEVSRKEALDPPVNILEHIRYLHKAVDRTDARTAAHTYPYEMSVYEHLDTYAARGGLDYTVVGRSLILFDVHDPIGQTAMVTEDDFLSPPIVTKYGMEVATIVTITDGKGHHGTVGAPDPYYGEWEVVHQAYDENESSTVTDANGEIVGVSVEEMESQARRIHSQSRQLPTVVRVPDNTGLNPNGKLQPNFLVPGVWVPLSTRVSGQTLTQMQKLDSMTVEEVEAKTTVQVVLSPVPQPTEQAE